MTGQRDEDIARLDERFADWVDGRLRPAERAALEAELAHDPALRRAAERYRRHVQVLRSALAPPDMEGSVANAVMAAVVGPRATPRAWRPYLASGVAAAALALVFVVVRLIPPASDSVREVAANVPSPAAAAADGEGVGAQERKLDIAGVQRAGAAEEAKTPVPETLHQKQARHEETEALAPRAEAAPTVRDSVEKSAAAGAGAEPRLPEVAPPLPSAPDLDLELLDDRALRGQEAGVPSARELGVGDLALVADLAAQGIPNFGRLAGAPANGAEVLAVLAPAIESDLAKDGVIDLRRIAVTLVPAATFAPASPPPPAAAELRERVVDERGVDERRAQAQDHVAQDHVAQGLGAKRQHDGAAAARRDDPSSAAAPPAAADRVFRVRGPAADVRAFAIALHERVSAEGGRVVFQRGAVSPSRHDVAPGTGGMRIGLLAGARDPESSPQPLPAGPSPAGPSPAGPASPGPVAPSPARGRSAAGGPGSAASKPAGDDGRTPPADVVEVLLVLRATGR